MKPDWQSGLREFMIEQITNTHLFSLIIFFYAFLCFELPTNYYLYPRLGLVLTGSLAFFAGGVACINKNLAKAKRGDFVEITYILLLLMVCLIFVIVAGNTDNSLKVLLLLPVIIMSTARGKWWGMAMAFLIAAYLLVSSLYISHVTPNRLFEANIIFSGMLLLVAWLVGGSADMEKKVRAGLADLNDELEQVVGERTRELAKSNRELGESEARFRSIFQNTSVGVALLDQDSAFLMVNDAFCDFLGFPRQEVLHEKVSLFVPSGENALENVLNDLSGGERQGCMLEQRFVRKDGESAWGRVNASMIRDNQRAPQCKIIICEDVTSLKTKESELRAQYLIFEEMHDTLQAFLTPAKQPAGGAQALVDLAASLQSGDYEDAVASRVIEVAREITGAAWVEYYSYDAGKRTLSMISCNDTPDEHCLQAKQLSQASAEEKQYLVHLVARQRKALYVPDVIIYPGWALIKPEMRSCYIVPLHYGENLFGVYVLLSDQVNDFSQQQQAMADALAFYISTAMENTRLFGEVQQACDRINSIQQQLLQSQKMEAVGQLAGGIAHDLNNQLTVIQTSVDLNVSTVPDNSAFSKTLKRIRLATEKSANLIRQLLLFGRKHPQFKVLIDVNINIRELKEMIVRLIGEDISIHLDLDPDLWTVRADATNIDQVIINLAINARDAMPNGGLITIKTENVTAARLQDPAGSFVCLSVGDTGTGIEKQHLPHIFEPFFTTKEAGKGTGLGLSVAYGIVDAHGGWIDVDSIPGAGSIFRIYLPAHMLADGPADIGEDSIMAYPQGSGESILLVEDDPDVANLTMNLLAENGYIVQSCRTVAEARKAFGQPGASWDLVLSDAVLPDGKGINLVRQLRKKQPSLEIILFSGYVDERASYDQIQQDGLLFLHKPFTANELMCKVQAAVDRRKGRGASASVS